MITPARLPHPVRQVGLVDAAAALAAGLVQLVAGDSIPGWTGNKQDPATLGAVTIALAVIAGLAAAGAPRAHTPAWRAAAAAALAVPALVGFTTVGRLWYIPGVLLLAATAMAILAAHQAGGTTAMLADRWADILIGALALVYLSLGVVAGGVLGALGVLGSIAIVTGLWQARRSKVFAISLLVAGTLPFAVIAWWSVVAPLTGTLLLAIGVPLVINKSTRPSSVTSSHGPRHIVISANAAPATTP